MACSVWPPVAAIYGTVHVVVWGPLTQRDGYVITPRSALEALKKCWGFMSSSRALLGGEYMASVPPKVGVLQFITNMFFWTFVLGCKVCLLSSASIDVAPRRDKINGSVIHGHLKPPF